MALTKDFKEIEMTLMSDREHRIMWLEEIIETIHEKDYALAQRMIKTCIDWEESELNKGKAG